jgi:hypothetical protein
MCFMMLPALNFHGQTITLTLNNIPENILCNEIWTEQNLDMSLVETTSDDCTQGSGSCYFGFMNQAFNSFPLWLYPSRLTIDLSSLQNIQMVEIDIDDNCGPDCTRAFLIDETMMNIDSVKNGPTGPQTLILDNPTQVFLTELAISSCEGSINEIRIFQNTSSINNELSGLKKLIRTVDHLGREVNHTTNQLLFQIYDDGSVEKKFFVE